MTSTTSLPFNLQEQFLERSYYTRTLLVAGTIAYFFVSPPVARGETSLPVVRQMFFPGETATDRRQSSVERAISRLKMFGGYEDDWDNDGAQAPNQPAINLALLYLTTLDPWHPTPLTTLSRSGEPIIEFDDVDTKLFGSIKFISDKTVELYAKNEGQPSMFITGEIGSPEVASFLSEKMNLPTM